MPNKKTSIFLLISVTVLIILSYLLINKITYYYNDIILDNKISTTNCEDMPTYSEAEKFLIANKEIFEKIKQINPGNISIEVLKNSKCENDNAEILIMYPSHQDKVMIEKQIEEIDFQKIPVTLKNY